LENFGLLQVNPQDWLGAGLRGRHVVLGRFAGLVDGLATLAWICTDADLAGESPECAAEPEAGVGAR
jgi:hypothetical protein